LSAPPGESFDKAWRECRPAVLDILRLGGKVLVHCRGGLGRAGTVAACLLVECGVDPTVAIAQVRNARPGAIETAAHERYVMRYSPLQAGSGG
jgi:ADP-ribosyl-[dinitrogen reductase] hydrolase